MREFILFFDGIISIVDIIALHEFELASYDLDINRLRKKEINKERKDGDR